eukprot:scaffold57120_cov29-Tisochrysis_lutea.AAC.1
MNEHSTTVKAIGSWSARRFRFPPLLPSPPPRQTPDDRGSWPTLRHQGALAKGPPTGCKGTTTV